MKEMSGLGFSGLKTEAAEKISTTLISKRLIGFLF